MYEIIVGRSESDRKALGLAGTIYIGKMYVKMGAVTSLSNKVYMDVARGHVVFIVGKRGCLTEETKIFTDKGYKNIKDYNELKDKIYSYNGQNFEWEKAKLVKYNLENEDLIKVENYDGQVLTMTKEHPLLVLEKDKKIWKKANELKIDDLLLTTTYTPEIKHNKESLRIARLLGFILADGTMQAYKGRYKDGRGYFYNGTIRRVRIINASADVLKTAKEDLEKEFGFKVQRYKKGKENCEVIEARHREILEKFKELEIPLGLKSHIIRVPKIVFESSNKFKTNFIKALYSCDGYVNKEGKHVVYYSKSRKFLEDLNLLLSHFNIQSTIRDKIVKLNEKIFLNYQLYITDHNSLENFKKIGFIDKSKIEKLKKHKFWQCKKRKKTQYIEQENLFGNKIVKISKINNIKEVYDLQVPKNHSFLANGVISHNSGKSYTMGVIAEEMADLPPEIGKRLAVLIVDTMGIYWTMKYGNEKDEDLLNEWDLPKRGLNVTIYTPKGFFNEYKESGMPTDHPFSIRPSELDSQDWAGAFGVSLLDNVGIAVERTVEKTKERYNDNYDIDTLIKILNEDEKLTDEIKLALENRFITAKAWGLFDIEGTPLKKIIAGGQTTVLDISCYNNWTIKCLVLGIICRRLMLERMQARKVEELADVQRGHSYFKTTIETEEDDTPIVWIMIDEAHEFLPKDYKTLSTDALVTILREGRQPGICLVLVTQQPGQIHTDVLTQTDIIIAHRITAKRDVEALNSMMQAYTSGDIQKYLNDLPTERGAAVILDDNSERMYPMRTHPRFTWHGGEAPTAIKAKGSALKKLGL